MPDNDTPTPATNQDAVNPAGVSDPYVTQPTTYFDLKAAEERNEKSTEEKQKEREEAFDANLQSSHPGDNTDSLDKFVATSPEYQNYGDVSHEPLEAEEETPERKAELRILKAMADRDANSKQALGGHTTYGESVEADPVGRGSDIVRGGSGDSNTARGTTEATPAPAPAKVEGTAKKAAPAN